MERKQYQNEYGTVFAVRELPDGKYRIMCNHKQNGWAMVSDPKISAVCSRAESLQEVLDAEATRKGWLECKPDKDPCDVCRCKDCGDETCPQSRCDGANHGTGCMAPDEDCPALPAGNGLAAPAPFAATPADFAGESGMSSAAPTFDYTGLDAQTVEYLHIAEREYAQGKIWAERGLRRMADGVAIAHEALCGTVVHNVDNGQFAKKEDTFRAWCESIGVGKSTAYKLLQVSAMFDKSTPNQQKALADLAPSLLYAAAKPSAPAELVQGVKDGDITTHKQYQALLAELKIRDAKIAELADAGEEADRRTERAESRAKTAEANLRMADNETRASDERAKRAETRAAEAEKRADLRDSEIADLRRKLKAAEGRPVEVAVVQPGEAQIEAWRKEGENRMAATLQDTVRQANKAKTEALQQVSDLQAQLADVRPDADACQRTVDTLYETAENLRLLLRTQLKLAQLAPATYGTVVAHVLQTAQSLRDTVRSCAPTGYTMDDEEEEFL